MAANRERFVTDCADRVVITDTIIVDGKELLVEGITQHATPGKLILHVSDLHGSLAASTRQLVVWAGEFVTQSRTARESNYRATNTIFGIY